MENEERLELVEEAIELIKEAQALVDEAVINTDIEIRYNAYGKFGFAQLLGNGNPMDEGLNDFISCLEEQNEC